MSFLDLQFYFDSNYYLNNFQKTPYDMHIRKNTESSQRDSFKKLITIIILRLDFDLIFKD